MAKYQCTACNVVVDESEIIINIQRNDAHCLKCWDRLWHEEDLEEQEINKKIDASTINCPKCGKFDAILLHNLLVLKKRFCRQCNKHFWSRV